MNSCINLYLQPTITLSARRLGNIVQVQSDEAGAVQTDETGTILQPDPEVAIVQADENNNLLQNENGTLNAPDLP